MKDWDEINELSFTPATNAKIANAPQEKWAGRPPKLLKLSWIAGDMSPRPHPHQPRERGVIQEKKSFYNEFQQAIKDSVELEKKDENLK